MSYLPNVSVSFSLLLSKTRLMITTQLRFKIVVMIRQSDMKNTFTKCKIPLKCHFFFIILKRFYLLIFRERGREGEREGEKHQCAVASPMPPTGDLAHKPGMCPDWESTSDPLVCRPVLNPLSHTSQDSNAISYC